MKDSAKIGIGIAALAIGALAFFGRKTLSAMATSALDAVNDALFRASIPAAARTYADEIKQVAQEKGVDPFILTSLGWRETRWGTIRGLNGTTGPSIIGADGTGYGLMQIDSGTWGDGLAVNDWTDPYTNISKGADVFNDALAKAQARGLDGDAALLAALGAYNHGPKAIGNVVAAVASGSDLFAAADLNTTQGNYASDVYGQAQSWQGYFAANLPTDDTSQA